MKCSEVMKKNVECARLNDTAAEAAIRMRERNIGFIPICDAAERLVGTITDRDLAIRVVAEQRSGDTTLLEEIMSRGAVTCKPSDDLQTAEQFMSQHKKSRIVCVDEQHRPVGVISLSDLANVEERGRASAILRSVSQREVH